MTIHTPYLGGGFGRRSELDFVRLAVRVALAAGGKPVKTTWSREEDTALDFYRPLAMARVRARVADGKPVALDLKLASPSPSASALGRMGIPSGGADSSIVQAAWDQPYAIANWRTTGYLVPEMLPVSFWRSVGASQNAFFVESAMDEIAGAAGADPVQMRLALMTHDPSRKVLETVAGMASWSGGSVGEGRGRGVAFSLSFGVPTAEIVEVVVTDQGIRITDVWAAADVGIALDPRNIEAQLISGINYGLSAAMMSEITLADGEVEQRNFHDYDVLRIDQSPRIHVRVLENLGRVRGVGEPGTPPWDEGALWAPDILREMPFAKSVDFA